LARARMPRARQVPANQEFLLFPCDWQIAVRFKSDHLRFSNPALRVKPDLRDLSAV
jgi:hypothetical protein